MKKNGTRSTIYLSVQSQSDVSFWISRITDGITAYAASRRIRIERVTADEAPIGEPVIIIGTGERGLIDETLALEARGALPLIINATVPGALAGRCSASFSIEVAVRDCVNYLYSLGCKSPALIGMNADSATDLVKRAVFAEQVARLGIASAFDRHSPTAEFTTTAPPRLSDRVDEFMKDFSPDRCDGAICANDTAAIMLISRLSKLGIAVGREFPVIGMGNSHIGKRMKPSLTSVDFDYYELGLQAARLYMYVSKLGELFGTSMSVSLPARLIVRDSTGNVGFSQIEPVRTEAVGSELIFTGEECERIIKLENYLQSCDAVDRELIFSSCESYRTLSERLFVGERTLKYRMSKIIEKLELKSKQELCEYVNELLGTGRE